MKRICTKNRTNQARNSPNEANMYEKSYKSGSNALSGESTLVNIGPVAPYLVNYFDTDSDPYADILLFYHS
jgi:hypothetical protein